MPPNILITGTPGCGKTTTAELLAIATNLNHIEIGKIVKQKSLHLGKDDKLDSFILDEDRLLDELESTMEKGGNIVDYHGCDFFPERWFDLVVVLTTHNDVLYPRLEKRGYSEIKIQENVQCEIMQVIVSEAHESYDPQCIVVLESNTIDQMEENVNRIEEWLNSFQIKNQKQ